MNTSPSLLTPDNCALILVDHQAGLAFGVQSIDRQTVLNNAVALTRTALAFNLPIVISTSATKVYSGPLLPALRALVPDHAVIERRNMNLWQDDAAHAAVVATGRTKLIFSGLLTEACISFPVLSALADGREAYVVGDACGGLTSTGHAMAMHRMAAAGASLTSWMQEIGRAHV